MEFKFNKKRVRVLSEQKEVPEWAEGVIYWTFRDERIHGKLNILCNFVSFYNIFFFR